MVGGGSRLLKPSTFIVVWGSKKSPKMTMFIVILVGQVKVTLVSKFGVQNDSKTGRQSNSKLATRVALHVVLFTMSSFSLQREDFFEEQATR